MLVRLHDGVMRSLPWSWTDLPVLQVDDERGVDEVFVTLLSPIALRDLVRFVRGHGQQERRQGESS